ncbi:hypothetical protein F5Y09DRAFT_160853 [Xylaria sp. FL1042]|nr:hypothetical protein F5Y09DRAFT_160853 [Xylaria sp. FL1042]
MISASVTPKKEGPLGSQREDPENEADVAERDNTTQDVSARHISSTKLMAMLRTKFGIGAYDVHMMQNCFYIKAPRKLSKSEIAACRQ